MRIISGPIIGAVTHNKAKVWIFWSRNDEDEANPRCAVFEDETGEQEISSSSFETVSSSLYVSGGIHGVAALTEISFKPGTETVYYKIVPGLAADTENSRMYSFKPFPEAGSDFKALSFGLISCHRPCFNDKKDAKYVKPMWRFLNEQMQKHDSRFLIQAGDQVYADNKYLNVWKWCMDGGSPEKWLKYYRQLYLTTWNFPEVQTVLRSFPQYMIWDDHEITNGWGSNIEHSTDPRQRNIFKVARQAYVEFQHSHNPDGLRQGKLYFAFNYGSAAFLVLDIRGHRDYASYNAKNEDDVYPLAGEEQWDSIKEWLASDIVQDSKILFVVSSVPVIHLSRKFRDLGIFKNDIRDQWSTDHNKKERRLLLDLLFKWSGDRNRPVFILSGDVHVGTVTEITKDDTNNKIYQISSSPITNDPASFLDRFLKVFSSKFQIHLEEGKKKPVHSRITHRYRRRNFAIINVRFVDQKPVVSLNMYEQDRSKPEIVTFTDF